MGYLPIQHHKLLRDLWGHRGMYTGNSCRDSTVVNYITKGKHPRRTDGIDCMFEVDYSNIGRTLSWYGNNIIEDRYLHNYGSNINSAHIPVILPRDVVTKAVENINVTGEFSLFRILNVFEPTHRTLFSPQRDLNFMRSNIHHSVLKKNISGVLSFEDMCLQKAHMQHDLLSLTNDIKQRYADKKYNRISACIKEVYSIIRACTRMGGMDKIAIQDYPLLNFQTENLALTTGYSNQLHTVVAARSGTYVQSINNADVADRLKPGYNTAELNSTHISMLSATVNEAHTSRLSAPVNEAYTKPINFHRAITEGYRLVLDSLNTGQTKADVSIRACKEIEVEAQNRSHRELVHIVSPVPTTLTTVLESQDGTANYQVNNHYLLGKAIPIKSLVNGNTLNLPGIPVARFVLNADLASDAILESMLAPINYPGISDYAILNHCVYSQASNHISGWGITGGSILGIILRGILLVEMLRVSPNENLFAKWLRARDSSIMPRYPYSIDYSLLPRNVVIPAGADTYGRLNLESALYGMCLSDNFTSGKYPPDICLVYMHLATRFIRRLLAFALKTLRNHRAEYAADQDTQVSVWGALHNILANISNYVLRVSSYDDKSVSLPLHAKYTIHSMLPTHIDDVVTRTYVFQSHLSLMESLASSLRNHITPASVGTTLPRQESLYSKISNGPISGPALSNLYTWNETGSILDAYKSHRATVKREE